MLFFIFMFSVVYSECFCEYNENDIVTYCSTDLLTTSKNITSFYKNNTDLLFCGPCPTFPPSQSPSMSPSESPTYSPSDSPSFMPSKQPSVAGPSVSPSMRPTKKPTRNPTRKPTRRPTSIPSMSPTTFSCNEKAMDILFLIDSSNTVNPNRFNSIVAYMNRMLNGLDISGVGYHVGIIQFATRARVVISLSHKDSFNKVNLKRVINRMKFDGGYTNIPEAFYMGYTDLQFRRLTHNSLVVIVSDFFPESSSINLGVLRARTLFNVQKVKSLANVTVQSVLVGNYRNFYNFAEDISDYSKPYTINEESPTFEDLFLRIC